MSEAKFTKGEWRRHYSPNGQEYVICDGRRNGGYAVASLSGSNSKANAHLIAAAPEMYAMLEKAKTLIEDYDYDYFCSRGFGEWSAPESSTEIEKLLAKARGEL